MLRDTTVARLDGQHDLDWLQGELNGGIERGEIEVQEGDTRSLEEAPDGFRDQALLSPLTPVRLEILTLSPNQGQTQYCPAPGNALACAPYEGH